MWGRRYFVRASFSPLLKRNDMKALHVAGLLLPAVCMLGCSTTYSSREQRAVAGVAIAIVLVGAAVHGSKDNDQKNLASDVSQPSK